ncbi:MAG: glycosyltransferase family 4 protein, partial [Candidatus Binatia bacterium]
MRNCTPHNVLYLQSTSEIGGSDISLLRLIEKLDKTRFRPHVVLPSDGPLVEALKMQQCKVSILKEMLKLTTRRGKLYFLRYILNYPRAAWKILRIIRRERIDLVHTNTLHNLYGFLAAKLARRPHVWHIREIVWRSRVFRDLELFLARYFADRIIVTSDAVAEVFGGGNGAHPSHLRKIPNGIDIQCYHPENDGSRVFKDLGLAPDAPLVGLVCRLDHWKGVDTFLRAVAICEKEYPKARYLVIGGPIEGREEYAERMVQ